MDYWQFLPEIPDVETSVSAAGGQDRLIVRRPLNLMELESWTLAGQQGAHIATWRVFFGQSLAEDFTHIPTLIYSLQLDLLTVITLCITIVFQLFNTVIKHHIGYLYITEIFINSRLIFIFHSNLCLTNKLIITHFHTCCVCLAQQFE